jgi:diguanylate cyclase (GGDEF)-like protein
MAIALLACAFASVARGSQIHVSGTWLRGWLMIVLHFAAALFAFTAGFTGIVVSILIAASLTWAGHLFMFAAVPFRREKSAIWMFGIFLAVNTVYIGVLQWGPSAAWALKPVAALFALGPLSVALLTIRGFSHPLRWTTVVLHILLAIYLLAVQKRPADGTELALNGLLCAVYLGCSINFLFAYRRATAGAFVTIAGFFTWSMVFVAGPMMAAFVPQAHVESEVWNLPKYVVAVGMILLLLENQIEHNKHLALHDVLTGLPNRRLFQDRLSSAIERARRTGSQAALLVIDLDRFKQVNDTLGHHVGDLLLQHVGSAFAGRVRRSDTVSRTGGDEFSVILEEPIDQEDATKVGQSLLQLLKEPIQLESHLVWVGASVGISIFPTDATEIDDLCIAADKRMYEAKYSSRSQDELDATASGPPISRIQAGSVGKLGINL